MCIGCFVCENDRPCKQRAQIVLINVADDLLNNSKPQYTRTYLNDEQKVHIWIFYILNSFLRRTKFMLLFFALC